MNNYVAAKLKKKKNGRNGQILKKFNLPNWNMKTYKLWATQLQAQKLKLWLKIFPKNQSPGPDSFKGEFYQTSREELIPILLKFFQKIAEERTLPNSFYKATITLKPKPDKDNTQKGKLLPISLMNIDAKILKKILANRIQQHIKKLIHHDQIGFIPGIQGFFSILKSINVIHHISKLKEKAIW